MEGWYEEYGNYKISGKKNGKQKTDTKGINVFIYRKKR